MRFNKKSSPKSDKKAPPKAHKKGVVGYTKKTALLEEAITYMNEGKYGRSSAALKELLALDPLNTEARRLFATLHLRLGSLISARTAFESLAREALERQDFWLAESLLREYLTAGPRCVPFLEMLGQVYEQKGDSMAAVAEYGKAIDVLIEDPDSDHPDRAADLFGKIRSLAPGGPEAFRLSPLFDSTSGQLLSPPSVANSNPLESSSILLEPLESSQPSEPPPPEPSQPSSHQPTESEAPASSLLEQPNHSAPPPALDVVCPETTEPQETETREQPADEKQVSEPQPQQSDNVPPPAPSVSDNVPSAAPVSEARDKIDPSLRLADDEAVMPAQAIMPDVATRPFIAADTTGFSFEKDAAPQTVEGPIADPDLSLHEVTQPISEAPSAPLPMPWDQVQDTTLSIPLPSAEPDMAQAPDPQPAGHTEDLSIPVPAVMPDDQPTLPVQPESLLSSMSWEEILAAVGKGPEVSTDPRPVTASVAPHEQIDQPLSVSEPSSFSSENPVLTPISEPVAEAQALSVPMPWEQVEEESVSILDHDPEPEFGVVPENPLSPDDTAPLQSEERTNGTNDATLAIEEAAAAATPSSEQEQASLPSPPLTLQEPVVEQSANPSVEQPLDHLPLPTPVPDETPVAAAVPSEPPVVDPSPVQFIVDETPVADEASLPAMAEEAPTVADPLPEAQPAEPLTTRAELETVSSEPMQAESEAVAEVAGLPESSGGEAARPDRMDDENPKPVVLEPFGIAPSPTDHAALLEEQPVPSSPITEPEPPAAAPAQAASGEIKILWNEQSGQSLSNQATGLLSRWLRRSKPEKPADLNPSDVEPSEGRAPNISPVRPGQTEHFTAEPTTPIIPAGDMARDPLSSSLAALPAGTVEKTARVKLRKPQAGSLSSHVRSGVVRLIDTCFSTTRSIIVSLVVLVSAVLASGLAAVGLAVLTWVLIEERPNTAFHNLTATPQRTLQEASSNGYLALLGFDRGTNQDAAQAGFARRFEKSDLTMTGACLASSPDHLAGGQTDKEGLLAGWYRDPDPAARFRGKAANLRAWVSQHDRSMTRYKQWLTMPFEDWGYGEPMSPNCPVILHAHRLYVAEGFAQDTESGIERLVADLTKWRHVMGHAKSLPIKMMAVGAINDDVAIVSGLLARPDLDDKVLGQLTKSARPLDQVEQSLRWPMQSELKAAGKIQDTILKPNSGETLPLYVEMISMMPLPAQKRLNLYADYYEASVKASAEARFAGLPKRAGFVRYPAESWLDYGLNPIENILSVPPLPEWQTYGGRIVELDAKLRLAGLQAWIRRSPKEQDIPTRMAKAGQALYDPFTGFPMLVNPRKGLIYSVGQDGKDHDGQPGLDIAAVIPSMAGDAPADDNRNASTSKTRP